MYLLYGSLAVALQRGADKRETSKMMAVSSLCRACLSVSAWECRCVVWSDGQTPELQPREIESDREPQMKITMTTT
jgi:hypothetical protein